MSSLSTSAETNESSLVCLFIIPSPEFDFEYVYNRKAIISKLPPEDRDVVQWNYKVKQQTQPLLV